MGEYDNPDGIIAMSVVLWAVATTAILTRFLSRRSVSAVYGLDDWLIVVAWVFLTGLAIIEIYACARHIWAVPLGGNIATDPDLQHRLLVAKYLEQPMLLLGVAALCFVKLSVVALYRRIFSASSVFQWVSLIWMILVGIWGFAFIVAGLAQCGTHYLTLFAAPQTYIQYCGDTFYLAGYGIVITDIVTDAVTLLLPVPMIYQLHCSAGRKLQIAGIFAIGLLSLAASCARAVIVIKATINIFYIDVIILYTSVSIWNYVEIVVGIVAACAVTFRPVLADIKNSTSFQSLASTFRRTSRSSSKSRLQSQNSASHSGDKIIVEKAYQVQQDSDLEAGVKVGSGQHLSDVSRPTHAL